jgi:pre-mRNA-splicing factor 38A
VGKPAEMFEYLEPLYIDYRRVRLRTEEGHFSLSHVDDLVDQMLRNEYLFDIALPRIPNR